MIRTPFKSQEDYLVDLVYDRRFWWINYVRLKVKKIILSISFMIDVSDGLITS